MARGNYDKIKNKFLTCGVCLGEYDEGSHTPRLLPCLHTFCSECIEQLITQRWGNDILCPLDRNKHVIVSEKGVDTFPKDNTRRDLLEFIGSQDKSEVMCKECTDNNNAIYRCINCAAFLCIPCYHAHKRTRFTRDHRIVRLEDLQNNPGLFNESIHEGFCRVPGHETVQLKLYCAAPECSKPICQICAASVHRDCAKHDVKDIIDVYEEKKISLQLLQRNVKDKIPQIKKEKETIERKTRILQEDWEQIIIEIQNAFDICFSKLEAKKKHMIDIAKKKIKSKEKILKDQIKSLQNQIKELQEGYQFTEETLLYRDAAGLLEIESVIQKRLQHLQIQESETTNDINIDFGFQKDKMITDFESYCNNMGYIVSLKVYPATSKKHIPGIKEESTYLRQDGAENVFGVVIDVTNEHWRRTVHYEFQGNVLSTQHIHHEECKSCKSILDLLRRANEKGVLFKKTGGNEITWNKDIPYKNYPIWDSYCDDYLQELKQSLAKYGIE